MITTNTIVATLCASMIACSSLAVAGEKLEAFGAVVSRIEVKDGTAWDVVAQIRAGLPEDALIGLSVEVPEADLRKIHVELLDVRSVPLGIALEYLSTATKSFRARYEHGLWFLRPITFDEPSGGLITRVYDVTEATLSRVGLTYQPDKGLRDSVGKSWPTGEDWIAHYSPKTKQLLLRADSDCHEDISALLWLVRRGYENLTIKDANKAEMATPRKPSD